MQTKQFFVTGKVQGVYFRASTQREALALGLGGWVRNLDDGRVEVLASGDAQALTKLEKWLWQGPERAHVESVEQSAVDDPATPGRFEVR